MVTSLPRIHTGPVSEELAAALAAITMRLGLSREFPPAVQAAAELAARHPALPDSDHTDIPFVTIDPAGSTDLDQAMYLHEQGDGYRAWYAIADVPAFVAPGGAVDVEARQRGQTIYAPDGRIPLHPPVISEGAASLLPGQLRAAFVWNLLLDADANVISVDVARSRIRSREQLTYEGAQRAIDDGSASATLQLLKRIGLLRIDLERKRGGASLRIPNVEIAEHDGRYELVRRNPLPVEDWNAQISLMTGMAGAGLMRGAKVGILRTMPGPEEQTVARFRRQAEALGHPWPEGVAYGEYLRGLDVTKPAELAIMHAAGSLFRGAGYTAFNGEVPADVLQAAVAAPYAHVTAPIRRLVDRFALVACAAICAKQPVPAWVLGALPSLPGIMASSDQTAGNVERAALDTVEAAALSRRIGEVFEATVISGGNGKGQIQLADPAVTAPCTGAIEPGTRIMARLIEANITTAEISFEAVTA